MAGSTGTVFSLQWEELPAAAASADTAEDGQPPAMLRAMTLNILADGLARGAESPREPDESSFVCPPVFEAYGAGGVAYDEEAVAAVAAASAAGKNAEAMRFRFRCSQENLDWNRRWPKLLAIIRELQPDVLGLQEVDLLQSKDEPLQAHDKQIRKDLNQTGYHGTFARKAGRACDGVGLFWRTERVRQCGQTETWKLGISVHVALAQPLLLDGVWRFTAIATHLKAGLTAEAEAARQVQATVLLQRLQHHPNAVVLADLNSHNRETVRSGTPQADADAAASSEMPQPLAYPLLTAESALRSAYKEVLNDEPCFTCWGGWFDREVRLVTDYIMFKGDLLQPRRVLQVPPVEEVVRYAERLPNADHPTDHVPLVADFALPGHAGADSSAGWDVAHSKKRRRR